MPCVEWSAMEGFDLRPYFKTHSGLFVSDDFHDFHLRNWFKAGCINIPAATGFSRDLVGNVYDSKIRAELTNNRHLFHEPNIYGYVAQLIDKQPGGAAGKLHNRYANLFYLEDWMVSVSWHAEDSRWCVRSWQIIGHRWRSGSRVFAHNSS